MTKLVKISEEAYAVVKGRAEREDRTMVAVLDEAVGVGVRKAGGGGSSSGGTLTKADPMLAARVPEGERYPWDEDAGPIQAPPKRPGRPVKGRVALSDPVKSPAVEPWCSACGHRKVKHETMRCSGGMCQCTTKGFIEGGAR